ncbi:hypothetical protein [Herbidospora cretacea]|uniref:hypothetical protein n=1 Tax=Herbidospora cretacea TaxID=28444 RepID=UPI0004C3A172|nr:hypothetical protein [Herbidospora cretacea]
MAAFAADTAEDAAARNLARAHRRRRHPGRRRPRRHPLGRTPRLVAPAHHLSGRRRRPRPLWTGFLLLHLTGNATPANLAGQALVAATALAVVAAAVRAAR